MFGAFRFLIRSDLYIFGLDSLRFIYDINIPSSGMSHPLFTIIATVIIIAFFIVYVLVNLPLTVYTFGTLFLQNKLTDVMNMVNSDLNRSEIIDSVLHTFASISVRGLVFQQIVWGMALPWGCMSLLRRIGFYKRVPKAGEFIE